MKNSFTNLSTEEQDWLDDYLDGTISPSEFEKLQDRLIESPGLRAVLRRYLSLDNSLQNEGGDASAEAETATAPWLSVEPKETEEPTRVIRFPGVLPLAAAAGVAFLLGTAVMQFMTPEPSEIPLRAEEDEPSAEGFAVIERLFDAQWAPDEVVHEEGEMLRNEVFRLASGVAEIQFFSGATMIVEGPAEISLKSAWEASCVEGAVRMKVPPAARGFKLHAPSTEIIDLGTEFGLVVKDGKGHVEVIDGEIAVRHREEDEKLLGKAEALTWQQTDVTAAPVESGQVAFPDVNGYGERTEKKALSDFVRWTNHRDSLAADSRLIAYYTFDRDESTPLIPDLTIPRNTELDGALILAEPVAGRWPGLKEALEFRRPGARVRVNIPGEFSAFTFMAWVRIDSLDRWYSALFMGDGYETGEPHWQIRDDGKMMLSVMVDDSRPNPKSAKDAGFHRVYFSPPMWDQSMSGEWLHLTSVFDPKARAVSHYVNGTQISTQEIEDEYFIDKLRIGNGEIGNWGQPFREDPTFAIRNLNGRMDEVALFKEALSPEEIAQLYRASRVDRR
ncbi:MAG: LamG-like jellyroll fold domain-containing protein [Verrucomicrobiota bacterium]